MKMILTIFLLFLISCKTPAQEFHVTVECFSEGGYFISYSYGDIHGSIEHAFDISEVMHKDWVVQQKIIFDDKPSAVRLAKTFTSYKIVSAYNTNLSFKYKKILAYRKAHHIIPAAPKQICCTAEKIY